MHDYSELGPNPDAMLDPISVEDWLPVDGTWVLAHYNGDNWKGQYWIVAVFVRGLSIADREALPDDHARKHTIHAEDEHGNNRRPYCWRGSGPGVQFGQDVDYWMALPEIPTESTTVDDADNDKPSSYRILVWDETTVLDAERWAEVKAALVKAILDSADFKVELGREIQILLMDGPGKGRDFTMKITDTNPQNDTVQVFVDDAWHLYALRGMVRDGSGRYGARHIGKAELPIKGGYLV